MVFYKLNVVKGVRLVRSKVCCLCKYYFYKQKTTFYFKYLHSLRITV